MTKEVFYIPKQNLILRRSTHSYCEYCGINLEYYGEDCYNMCKKKKLINKLNEIKNNFKK